MYATRVFFGVDFYACVKQLTFGELFQEENACHEITAYRFSGAGSLGRSGRYRVARADGDPCLPQLAPPAVDGCYGKALAGRRLFLGFYTGFAARGGRWHIAGNAAEHSLDGRAVLEDGHAAHRNGFLRGQFEQRVANVGQCDAGALGDIRIEQLAVFFQVQEDGIGVHVVSFQE